MSLVRVPASRAIHSEPPSLDEFYMASAQSEEAVMLARSAWTVPEVMVAMKARRAVMASCVMEYRVVLSTLSLA